MKKNTNLFVVLMAIIGTICTAAVLVVLFKDRIKECPLCKKYLGEEDDFDLDFDFEDDLEEEDSEEEAVEDNSDKEAEEDSEEDAAEEEAYVPKARRGYIPLKFQD